MRGKSIILYVSLALNVILLVLAAWPVSGQVPTSVGNYTAISAKGGGNQDALWLANRSTGKMVIYQYELGRQDNPVQVVGIRDLRADLEERQIGNLMLQTAGITGSTSVVFVIDTDSDRMVVYEYNRPNLTLTALQKIDLRADFAKKSGAEETGEE